MALAGFFLGVELQAIKATHSKRKLVDNFSLEDIAMGVCNKVKRGK
jgi:hypothetical protein